MVPNFQKFQLVLSKCQNTQKNVETSHSKKPLHRNWQAGPTFTEACCMLSAQRFL